MARTCDITGRGTQTGNTVSHSNRKAKKKLYLNLHYQRFYLEGYGIWVRLRVSSRGRKIIGKYPQLLVAMALEQKLIQKSQLK